MIRDVQCGGAATLTETLMAIEARPADDRSMPLSATLAWLVDAAAQTPTPELFLATLGQRLIEDGAPLAGGALTLASPHPLIAQRTWLWRAESGEVIEALGFAAVALAAAATDSLPGEAGRRWLAALGDGAVHEEVIGRSPDGPRLGWVAPRPFTPAEAYRLREA